MEGFHIKLRKRRNAEQPPLLAAGTRDVQALANSKVAVSSESEDAEDTELTSENRQTEAVAAQQSDLIHSSILHLSLKGFMGAVRVKDGLFLGDQLAAIDYEFFSSNVVLYVVNCCAGEVANHFEGESFHGQKVEYLSLPWNDSDGEGFSTNKTGNVFDKIYNFIAQAEDAGASCLIHSKFGRSRSVCALCAYFMKRYKWSAKKALEFLISRRPDLVLRRSFIKEILAIEHRMAEEYNGLISSTWDEASQYLTEDELLLQNTFKNAFGDSLNGCYAPLGPPAALESRCHNNRPRVQWKVEQSNSEGQATDESPAGAKKKLTSILRPFKEISYTSIATSPARESRVDNNAMYLTEDTIVERVCVKQTKRSQLWSSAPIESENTRTTNGLNRDRQKIKAEPPPLELPTAAAFPTFNETLSSKENKLTDRQAKTVKHLPNGSIRPLNNSPAVVASDSSKPTPSLMPTSLMWTAVSYTSALGERYTSAAQTQTKASSMQSGYTKQSSNSKFPLSCASDMSMLSGRPYGMALETTTQVLR